MEQQRYFRRDSPEQLIEIGAGPAGRIDHDVASITRGLSQNVDEAGLADTPFTVEDYVNPLVFQTADQGRQHIDAPRKHPTINNRLGRRKGCTQLHPRRAEPIR